MEKPLRLNSNLITLGNRKIFFKIVKAPKKEFTFNLRIPGWSQGTTINMNDDNFKGSVVAGSYSKLTRKWKKGETIELNFPMPFQVMQANPLVEETKNQVAVKRGPLVYGLWSMAYGLESNDMSTSVDINEIVLDIESKFNTKAVNINNREVVGIHAKAFVPSENWTNTLYQPISSSKTNDRHNLSTLLQLGKPR